MLYLENNLATGAFTDDRLEVLGLLSSQAAISIENARLYVDLQASENKYRTLFEDTRDVIFITAPDGQILEINPACESIFGYTREEMRHMLAQDLYVNPNDRQRFRLELEQHGAVRNFEVRFRHKDGTEHDCVMTATVRYAGDGSLYGYQGIIRDITGQKQAEQERLQLSAIQREMTLAREIQQSLLPPPVPAWDGLDAIFYSVPARQVGGDLYAYHTLAEQRYALVVADVSGIGMPAALLMAVSLSAFQSTVVQNLALGELMSHMGRTLLHYTQKTGQNCALVYAEINRALPHMLEKGEDPSQCFVRLVNAGCIAPVIRRSDGTVEWVEIGGMPLGVSLSMKADYDSVECTLWQGDMLILLSDGVVDASNEAGELFGFERLEQAIRTGPLNGAQAMLNHIRAAIRGFTTGAELHDDLTIAVVQV
jgi:PAS domain S-box-containing protein